MELKLAKDINYFVPINLNSTDKLVFSYLCNIENVHRSNTHH